MDFQLNFFNDFCATVGNQLGEAVNIVRISLPNAQDILPHLKAAGLTALDCSVEVVGTVASGVQTALDCSVGAVGIVAGGVQSVAGGISRGCEAIEKVSYAKPLVGLLIVGGVVCGIIYFSGGSASFVSWKAFNSSVFQKVLPAVQYVQNAVLQLYNQQVLPMLEAARTSGQFVIQELSKSEMALKVGNFLKPYASFIVNHLKYTLQYFKVDKLITVSCSGFKKFLAFLVHQAPNAVVGLEMGVITYAKVRLTSRMIEVTSEKTKQLADNYKAWRQDRFKTVDAEVNVRRQRFEADIQQAMGDMRVEGVQEQQAEITEVDLDKYECPISFATCLEPVRVMCANGVVKYFERAQLVDWMENCLNVRGVPPYNPTNREVLQFAVADVEVDQEAQEDIRRITIAIRRAQQV